MFGDLIVKEKETSAPSGILMLLALLTVMAIDVYSFVRVAVAQPAGMVLFIIIQGVVLLLVILGLAGLFTVQPNQGVALQLFGRYTGTVKTPGSRWANRFYSKRPISLRVRNFETSKLKVNDTDGNPIEIAAVVVWKVIDTAEAAFQVDDYENYVHVQSEAAIRNLATAYPYDTHEDDKMSLRGNTAEVAEHLQ